METRVNRTRSEARRPVELPPSLTVKRLSELLGISPVECIKQLMRQGIMANVNQVVDFATAAAVAANLEVPVKERAVPPAAGAGAKKAGIKIGKAQPRPPVVTILGHVDHGKTTLLDAIRRSNIVATEAGEITQHIGAYQVEVEGKPITFLDTPGHAAFTAMRARGARVTDIAVLVVAADDGVMPQTAEALNHARAAGVPVVVTMNKMDKPEADPERVKRQLSELGLVVEEWGGDTIAVPVSAKKREGIAQLLEYILLVAEMQELLADPDQPAVGAVIEAGLDKNRGPMATLLIQNGTLEVGNVVVAGDTWGKVKAMFNDRGKRLHRAGPATPVAILGLSIVPAPGDTFTVVGSEREARSLLERQQAEKGQEVGRPVTLEAVSSGVAEGKVKELNIVLKTDVQGSVEAIRSSLEKLSTERVRVRVIHAASGPVTESDVMLALASKGLVLGFNTRPEPGARRMAESEGVQVLTFNVIYTLIDAVDKALQGMLEPIYEEVIEARGEVIATFSAGGGLKRVGGVRVLEGKMAMGAQVRVRRGDQVVADSKVKSLRRFQDNVAEVAAGLEAGVGVDGFWDFQVGDKLECYRKERVA